MTSLNYASVRTYWSKATPSLLGPYMMEGFGFPARAGQFRFLAETKIVHRLIQEASQEGAVLDLGAGNGCWSEYFAKSFARVVAMEASPPLFEALGQRCSKYPNFKAIRGDVMSFEPEGRYALVFLGGLLMYLNDRDVTALLRKISPSLQSGGLILCRETTVRTGAVTRRHGDYQANYRSTEMYTRIFKECGFSVVRCEMNVPYVLMQMGCEFMKKWQQVVPKRLQASSIIGQLVYSLLRLSYPWGTRIPATLGLAFPKLTNHFFLLQPGSFQEPGDRIHV